MQIVKSICPFCGVGCGVELYVNSEVLRLAPTREHPVSRGHLCGKGTLSYETVYSWDRLTYPLKRAKDTFVRISWEEAIKEIVEKLKEITKAFGPEAIAFYGGCQNTLEEVYLMQKIARALNTNNVDSCARVCHEPSAMALKEMLGIGASSISVEMIPLMKTLVIAGESITESHPVLSQYLTEAKQRGTKIVVIDPRYTGTARFADLHLKIRPGTDVALFNAVGNYLIENSLYNKEFVEKRTEEFEEYAKGVSKYTINYAEEVTGIEGEKIEEFAKLISKKGVIFSWGLGLTQSSGVDGVRAFIDLALLTGNFGKYGGVIVYRGQTNVQGSGDLVKPDVFPIGPMNEENAEKLEKVWGFKPSTKPGLTVTEAILRDNEIKAMVLMGYNPLASLPNRRKVEERLRRLDLLVVIDAFMTDTASLAHYVLPSAVWAEKEGSVTSLDRLVKWRFKAVDPPGEAKPDYEILGALERELGFDFATDPKLLFEEIKKVSPIYSNLTLDSVMDYSATSRYPNGELYLYDEKFNTPSGKGRFIFREYREVKKGLVLLTVRNVTRYNTDIVTSRIPGFGVYESSLIVSPSDAKELGLSDGDEVVVSSECGSISAKVKMSPEALSSTVVMYMHDKRVNYVVCDELDESKAPKYKYTIVEIRKSAPHN
jgi:formate dehydrogenase major subunit